jgi:serine protease
MGIGENLWAQLPQQFIVHKRADQMQGSAQVDQGAPSIRRQRPTSVHRVRAGESANRLRRELERQSDVLFVEPDVVMKHFGQVNPNDPKFNEQWNLFDGDGGAHFQDAWEISKGSQGQIIAIVDTGVLSHPDLNARMLPGAMLIRDQQISGSPTPGRSHNATDLGDFVAPGDPCYSGWPTNSSWHGTHVAGIAAAQSNNGQGISGGDWRARILPVRVLGKCGGYSSDIADGIRWAAGGEVEGLSPNPHPATVINLSLGGFGMCGEYMQSAIDFALSKGAVVVVAAGNESANLDFQSVTPANCRGVLTVGASTIQGSRAGYSNFGERIDLMAPGGDFQASILSTHNMGQTTPSSASYREMNGTSMAAPHVAAAASLVRAVAPKLPPLQVVDVLKRSTKAFGFGSFCDETRCGDGLLDVYEALRLARVTSPDARFGVIEPIQSGNPDHDNARLGAQGSSGGCGLVDLGGGPGSSGPGGGMMIFTLLGLMHLSLLAMRRRLSTSKVSAKAFFP